MASLGLHVDIADRLRLIGIRPLLEEPDVEVLRIGIRIRKRLDHLLHLSGGADHDLGGDAGLVGDRLLQRHRGAGRSSRVLDRTTLPLWM